MFRIPSPVFLRAQDFLLSYDRESIKLPGKQDAGNGMSFEFLGRRKELFLAFETIKCW